MNKERYAKLKELMEAIKDIDYIDMDVEDDADFIINITLRDSE